MLNATKGKIFVILFIGWIVAFSLFIVIVVVPHSLQLRGKCGDICEDKNGHVERFEFDKKPVRCLCLVPVEDYYEKRMYLLEE